MRAVEALVASTVNRDFSGPLSERLERLDTLTPHLFGGSGRAAFHVPETLEAIANADELGVRLLLPGLLHLACAHRPTTAVVDWAIGRLSSTSTVSDDRMRIADALSKLPLPEAAHLREQLQRPESRHVVDQDLILATLVDTDPLRVAATVKNAAADWQQQLRAIVKLPVGSVSDPDVLQLVVTHLEQRTRQKTELVANALARMDPVSLTSGIAERIVRAISGKHGSELVRSTTELARRNPRAFCVPLTNAYLDGDNPGRDAIGEVLPGLGNHLVDSPLLDRLMAEAGGADRRQASRTIRLLARTLCFCEPAQRDELLAATAGLIGAHPVTRLISHEEASPELVQWLIEKLNSGVAVHALTAARLLLDRSRNNSDIKERRHLIDVYRDAVPPEFSVSATLSSRGWLQDLARATSGFLRIFYDGAATATALRVEQLVS